MKQEDVTGICTVDEKEVPYSGTIDIMEDLDDCRDFVVDAKLVKKDEDPEDAVVRGFVDYARRYQRATLRPSQNRSTGAQPFQRAIGKALKNQTVTPEEIAAALKAANIEV